MSERTYIDVHTEIMQLHKEFGDQHKIINIRFLKSIIFMISFITTFIVAAIFAFSPRFRENQYIWMAYIVPFVLLLIQMAYHSKTSKMIKENGERVECLNRGIEKDDKRER